MSILIAEKNEPENGSKANTSWTRVQLYNTERVQTKQVRKLKTCKWDRMLKDSIVTLQVKKGPPEQLCHFLGARCDISMTFGSNIIRFTLQF